MMFPPANVIGVQDTLDGSTDVLVTCPRCSKVHTYQWPNQHPGPLGLRLCPRQHQHILVQSVPAHLTTQEAGQ